MHETTTPFYSQGNAKLERFHMTMGDLLAKLSKDNTENWDLTEALMAVRFCILVTSRFSAYYMLYGRDVVLPIDNLLKPSRKYMEEDQHALAIEKYNKIFTQVRKRMGRAQKKRKEKGNKGRKKAELRVEDTVFYKIQLDQRWEPYYIRIGQAGPVPFVIWDQMAGS